MTKLFIQATDGSGFVLSIDDSRCICTICGKLITVDDFRRGPCLFVGTHEFIIFACTSHLDHDDPDYSKNLDKIACHIEAKIFNRLSSRFMTATPSVVPSP